MAVTAVWLLLLIATAVQGSKCPNVETPSKHIVCYYEGAVDIAQVNLCNCTHLVFTNAVSIDGFNLTATPELLEVEEAALEAKQLHLMFSVNFKPEETAALLKSSDKKLSLLDSIVSFVQSSDFNGVEINFDFASDDGAKKEDLSEFLKDLRERLDHHKRVKRDGYSVFEEQANDFTTNRYTTEKYGQIKATTSGKKRIIKRKKSRTPREDKNVDFYDDDAAEIAVADEELEEEPLLRRTKRRKQRVDEEGEMKERQEEILIFLRLSVNPEIIAKKYDLKAITKYVDYFVVPTHMITDDSEDNLTYHPSRLMGLSDMLNTDSILDLLTGLGAIKEKMIVSLPASVYQHELKDAKENIPRSHTVGEIKVISQTKMCSLMKSGNWTVERDEDLTAPYAFSKRTWLAFEDEISVNIKAKYIILRELGGAAIYPIDSDTQGESCLQKEGGRIAGALQNNFGVLARKPRQAVLESLQEQIHDTAFYSQEAGVHLSEYRIVRVVDHSGAVHVIRKNTKTEFECSRQGYFSHPLGCNKFYRCVKFNQYTDDYTVFEYDCPAGLAFDERWEVCVWPGSLPNGAPCTGSSEIAPVPRAYYQCPNVEGYYADPENCRWFFACLDHARDGVTPLTAYEFRCPFGLVFDENTLVCDWPWKVGACGARGLAATVVTKVSGAATYQGTATYNSGAAYVNGLLNENRASFATVPDYVISGGRISNKAGGVVLNQNLVGGLAGHGGIELGVPVGSSAVFGNKLAAGTLLSPAVTPSSILVEDGGSSHRSHGGAFITSGNPSTLIAEDGGSSHRSHGAASISGTPSTLLVEDGGSRHRSEGAALVSHTPTAYVSQGAYIATGTRSSIPATILTDGGSGHRSEGASIYSSVPSSGVALDNGQYYHGAYEAAYVNSATPSTITVNSGANYHLNAADYSAAVTPAPTVTTFFNTVRPESYVKQTQVSLKPTFLQEVYSAGNYGQKSEGYAYNRPAIPFDLPIKSQVELKTVVTPKPVVYAQNVVPVATLKPVSYENVAITPKPIQYSQIILEQQKSVPVYQKKPIVVQSYQPATVYKQDYVQHFVTPKPVVYQQPAVTLKPTFYQQEIVTPAPVIVQKVAPTYTSRPVIYQQEVITPRPIVYQQEITPVKPQVSVLYQQQYEKQPIAYQQTVVSPKPVVYQQQYATPKPVVYQQEVKVAQPVVYQQHPKPVVYEQQYVTPKPVVYQQEVNPVVYQQEVKVAQPVAYQQQYVTPKPVVYQQEVKIAKPAVYQQEVKVAQPVVYQQQYVTPKPVVYEQQYVTPKPVVYQQEVKIAKPVVYQQEVKVAQPVVYQQQYVTPKPAVYQQEYVTPKPVVYQQEVKIAKPVVYQQEVKVAQPVVYQQEVKQYVTPKPVVYQQEVKVAKPVVYQQDVKVAQPVVYQQQYVTPKPVVYQQEVKVAQPVVYQQQYVTPKPVVYQQEVKIAKPVVYQQEVKVAQPVVYQQQVKVAKPVVYQQQYITPKPVVYQQQYITPRPVTYQQEVVTPEVRQVSITPKPVVYQQLEVTRQPIVYQKPQTTPKAVVYQQVFNVPQPAPVTPKPVVYQQYQQEVVTPKAVVYQQEIATPKQVVYQQEIVTPKPVVYQQQFVTKRPVVYQQEVAAPVYYEQKLAPPVYKKTIKQRPIVVQEVPQVYQENIAVEQPELIYQQDILKVKARPVVYEQKKIIQTTQSPLFIDTVTKVTPAIKYRQEYQAVAYQVPQINVQVQTTPKTVYADSYQRVTPVVKTVKQKAYAAQEYLPPVAYEVTSSLPVVSTERYAVNSNIDIAPPPEGYELNLPTSTEQPSSTLYAQGVRTRVRVRPTTEASREYLPPVEPTQKRGRGRGKATIVSIGQVDKAEVDDQNLEGVLDKYSGKNGPLTEEEKERFVTKVIKGNGKGTIKLGREPEVSTVGYEITSQRGRARVRTGVRKYSSTSSTTTEGYEETDVSITPETDDDDVNNGDISLATLDLKNLKIKKDKKTVIVVSQVSDANPLLIGKLAGQCSCQSNKVDIKSRGRKPSGDNNDGAGSRGRNGGRNGDSNSEDDGESGRDPSDRNIADDGYPYDSRSAPRGRSRGGNRNGPDTNGNGAPENTSGNGRQAKARGRRPNGEKDSERNGPGVGKSISFGGDDGQPDDIERNAPTYTGAIFGTNPEQENSPVIIGDSPRKTGGRRPLVRISNTPSVPAGQVNVEIVNDDDGTPVLVSSTTTILPDVSSSILVPIAPARIRTKTTSTTTEAALPQKPTGRRIPSRSKARVPFVDTTPALFSPITADEIASTVEYQDVRPKSRNDETKDADPSKVRAGAAFDRYGPGGWRSADETLQGSVDCKRPGLFRHPKYCNKFYSCNFDPWKKRYTLSVFNCPVHLAYDDAIGACNWPSKGPACADDNLLV